jgi:iron complex transport system ATP-binding protein
MTDRLAVESIRFQYPSRHGVSVFDDISLSVAAGEVLMLLGPNGTGKSTLLKCMAGLLAPQAGRVSLDGVDLHTLSPARLARRVGYVPQSSMSTFPFRVRDIVVMGRAPHLRALAAPSRADAAIAEQVLHDIGIAHLAHRTCHQISGGEWQMVLIARALAQQPDVLLLDEPTSHLDVGNQVRILGSVRQLSARGLTVVMATHAPDQAFMAADRVAMIKDGRLMAHGTPADVLTPQILGRAYGVEVEVVELKGDIGRRVCAPILRTDGSGWAGREGSTESRGSSTA